MITGWRAITVPDKQLCVGERVCTETLARIIVDGAPLFVFLPMRQSFGVTVDCYRHPTEIEPVRLYVVLEGWKNRQVM